MVSLLLDLLAPKAQAELIVEFTGGYTRFVSYLTQHHLVLSSSRSLSTFRIDGHFFSDLRATKVVFGHSADPKQYANVGFVLTVHEVSSDQILLQAEERVIFGYLELGAVNKALFLMLEYLSNSIKVLTNQNASSKL